jgi:hypothetical protein
MNHSTDIKGPPTAAMQDKPRKIPHGFAGFICDYLYNAAPRPNEEAAIAGMLGLLAGINGGSYTISSPPTGLNLYVALVMKSAIGKESMSHALWLHRHVCEQMSTEFPQSGTAAIFAQPLVNSDKKASGPAIVRSLGAAPSQAQFFGEIGVYIEQLCAALPGSPLYSLKELLLDLYDKSGPHQQIGGIEYSKKEDDKAAVSGPAYSMVGSSTPATFYGAVNGDASEGGFLSRWTVVPRQSRERPPPNAAPVLAPHPDLLGALALMTWYAVKNRANRPAIPLREDAEELLEEFNADCDASINATDDDAERAIWNRAYLKVYRVAGLIALANFFGELWWWSRCRSMDPNLERPAPTPQIIDKDVEWAIALELQGINEMTTRLRGGDLGTDDEARKNKVLDILEKYIAKPPERWAAMAAVGFVPDQHLQNMTCKAPGFAKHKMGANQALKFTLRALIDAGLLMEATTEQVLAKLNKKCGKCYLITGLPSWQEKIESVKVPWDFRK